MTETTYWNQTVDRVNERTAIRQGIVSDAISKLQDMYPHISFGRTLTVNNRTYHIRITEQTARVRT